MSNEKPINSIVDFLEACDGKAPVLMDGEVYQDILSVLIAQAKKTSDKGTREALEKVIAELSEPLKGVEDYSPLHTDPEKPVDLGGIVHMGEHTREYLLQAIKKDTATGLEVLRAITPKKSVINNSKLAQEIIDSFAGEGIIPIRVSGAKAKKDFAILASLTFEGPNIKITGRQPYTAYDRAVLNGICSLWQAGNTAFTAAMVYRAMNGISSSDDGGAYVSPQAVGDVTRSIEKQRVTRLTVDCTAQMDHYKNLKRAKFDAMMISVDGIEMTAQNGQRVKAYTFTNPNRPPVLYEYSRSIGQVLSIPPRLLNSSGAIRTTEEVIAIREYLIRRIEGMKGNNSLRNDRITYRGIYKELGIDIDALTGNAAKDTPKRVRKNTEALLSHFVSEDFIKGFTEYREGRTIAGVQISL